MWKIVLDSKWAEGCQKMANLPFLSNRIWSQNEDFIADEFEVNGYQLHSDSSLEQFGKEIGVLN